MRRAHRVKKLSRTEVCLAHFAIVSLENVGEDTRILREDDAGVFVVFLEDVQERSIVGIESGNTVAAAIVAAEFRR